MRERVRLMSDRPLILLDVDGCINPFSRPGPEWQRQKATSYSGSFNLWINPEHGKLLTALADEFGAELTWATMWDHYANSGISPLVGLPELPVIVMDDWEEPDQRNVHPKTPIVASYVQKRPFVWFDDQLDYDDNAYLNAHDGVGDFLLVHVNAWHGIGDEHIHQAAEWLANHTNSGESS